MMCLDAALSISSADSLSDMIAVKRLIQKELAGFDVGLEDNAHAGRCNSLHANLIQAEGTVYSRQGSTAYPWLLKQMQLPPCQL